MKRAIFIDRDGTLIVEKELVRSPQDVEFMPGAKEGLRKLQAMGYTLVIATNQSAVGNGFITPIELSVIHQYIVERLRDDGIHIAAIYYCPHRPDAKLIQYRCECDCRKPMPGMLLKAARELDLDLSQSWIVGDAKRDVMAGIAAGCRTALVLTGRGPNEKDTLSDLPAHVHIVDNLIAFAALLSGMAPNKTGA